MTKIHSLRRVFLPCFTSSTTTTTAVSHPTTTKKRLSTSLRDDILPTSSDHHDLSSSDSSPFVLPSSLPSTAPPRPSKTMVIGTIFGHRRGHVWFAVQHDRLKPKPTLLLQLSIPTQTLVQELQHGLVRLALECHISPESDLGSCHLRSIPLWTLYCNGRKVGFALRKKPTEPIRLMMKSIQTTTVGAGVIPSFGLDSGGEDAGGDLIYMRANYECMVGGSDSESFHLINPDGCLGQGQELSIFLMRSR